MTNHTMKSTKGSNQSRSSSQRDHHNSEETEGWKYDIAGQRIHSMALTPRKRAHSSRTRDGSKQSIPQEDLSCELSDEGEPCDWDEESQRLFFPTLHQRRPNVHFARGSQSYRDFKVFFSKYLRQPGNIQRQGTKKMCDRVRDALDLFDTFLSRQAKKRQDTINKERESLPIAAYKEKILECISRHQVTLIAADTGAGKSTQLPQFLIEQFPGLVAVTQPRRIACYSLSKRVGYECGSPDIVGYQVRFEGRRSSKNRIVFLTEGVLIRQFASDPFLSDYGIIFIDEIHERHTTGDFLLGIMKHVCSYRKDIKLVLMSATINAELFSNYFNAPCIQVPGRMYPVDVEYLPIDEPDPNLVDPRLILGRNPQVSLPAPTCPRINVTPYQKILERIDQSISSTERGDLLMFVSGKQEISTLCDSLQDYANRTRRWILLPLHASLSVSDQERVFDIAPFGVRKCIVSTNVAETSITIDGIRFIVDSGRVKEMGYNSRAGLAKLSEYWISASSAKQRAGRAGRTGPGTCFRLYSQAEFEGLLPFPIPEIMRTPLLSTFLQIMAMRLGDPRDFDFIERPSMETIEHSMQRLGGLGAITGPVRQELVTPLGHILSLLPVEVSLGKMLILGVFYHLPIMNALVACLSVQSPFVALSDPHSELAKRRADFDSVHGDPFILLNLLSSWLSVKHSRNTSSRKWCKTYGVEEQRLYEIIKLKTSYDRLLRQYFASYVPSESREEPSVDGKGGHLNPDEAHRISKLYRDVRNRQVQSSSTRKVLSLEEEVLGEDESDAMAIDADVSVSNLEFLLRHNAKDLSYECDSRLFPTEMISMIKLILCSGLYPNFAMPDVANSSRRMTEQVFHTQTTRFISLHPSSFFAAHPDLLLTKAHDSMKLDTQSSTLKQAPSKISLTSPSKPSLSLQELHQKKSQSEILCFVELLETTKPYLMSVFKTSTLSYLLCSMAMHIAPDMRTLIADGWLCFYFLDSRVACEIIQTVNWIRCAVGKLTSNLLADALKSIPFSFSGVSTTEKSDDLEASISKVRNLRALCKVLPPEMARLRQQWEDSKAHHITSFSRISSTDIIVKISQLLGMMEDAVSVERLRMQDLPTLFGYEPYQSEEDRPAKIQLTPEFAYFVKRDDLNGLKNALQSSEIDKVYQHSVELNVKEDHALSGAFACPTCHKSFDFGPIDILRHRKTCSG